MNPTVYRTTQVDGLSIFYREAGPKDAPTLLLLHGLPSSSRMFEPLFARLSDRYHLIAPDYPGFGHSDWPDPKKFAYTFDHYRRDHEPFHRGARTLALHALHAGLRRPGWLSHGARASGTGRSPHRARRRRAQRRPGRELEDAPGFWADRAANESALRTNLLSLATTRDAPCGKRSRTWSATIPTSGPTSSAFLNQPGQAEIQSDLFYDYRTNVDAYPKWQAWMREKQPRLLVIWGKYELSFDPSEPESYRKDVPDAEVHIVDGGHFALDTAADEIAALAKGFMASSHSESKARLAG